MDDPLGAFLPGERLCIPGASLGPLSGLEFAVKDVFDIAGRTAGAGHPAWLASHSPAIETAPVVLKLLAAGASVCGVTVMDELAVDFGGESVYYGAPVNAKAPGRVVGGSSSGSASAVAGSLADFALGTDSGGSVRVPASYCGLFGIRPTHGRIPLEGTLSASPSVDTIGWFARDPDTFIRVGRVLLDWNEPPALPQTLLIAKDAFDMADAQASNLLAVALQRIGAFFREIRSVSIGSEDFSDGDVCFRVLQSWEAWSSMREWIAEVHPRLGPMVQQRFDWTAGLKEEEVRACRGRRDLIAEYLHRTIKDSVLMLPTASGPPPICKCGATSLADLRARTLRLTCVAGLSGMPQVSLPLVEVDGLPLGVSLIVKRGADETLLRLAQALS